MAYRVDCPSITHDLKCNFDRSGTPPHPGPNMNNIIQNWKSSTLTGLRKFDNEIGIWLQVLLCWCMLLYISMITWFSNLAKLFFERLDHGNNFENRRSSELNLQIIIIILTLCRRFCCCIRDEEILESLRCYNIELLNISNIECRDCSPDF